MPNINLISPEQNSSFPDIFGKKLVIAVVLLAVMIGLYGTLLFMKKRADSQIEAEQNQYETEYGKFLKSNANQVIDFKNRSEVSQKLLAENNSVSDFLPQIEGSVLPSVYFNSLIYDKIKKTVSLVGYADNFNTIAEQVASFQQSGYFSSVNPGRSYLDAQSGKVNFSIDLQIK